LADAGLLTRFDRFLVAGRGRLGTSLHGALTDKGLTSQLIAGRELSEIERQSPRDGAALLVLAVPDPVIGTTAVALAEAQPSAVVAVIHLSGLLGLSSLAPLADVGIEVGAFHPFQSFPQPRPPEAFAGSTFGIDASSELLLGELDALARLVGGVPRRVRDPERALYHAAGVVASNYLTCLAHEACLALQAAGWDRDEALQAVIPLMAGAVENLSAARLPGALIGPIRRGDPAGVALHLAAIAAAGPAAGRLESVYRVLGLVAVELAAEAGLEASRAQTLTALLETAREES
jgi:predicted short-subunit dehydrogenase-like oxidoreductase (DUF2520 family)